MEDFGMVKSLISVRLARAVAAEQNKINDYNQKANFLRAPIIARIVKHFTDDPGLTCVSPIAGVKLLPECLGMHAQYLGDKTMRICANYNHNDNAGNCVSFSIQHVVPMPKKFQKELAAIPTLNYEHIDIDAVATEKAAEILLQKGDIMEKIEAAMKDIIPVADIPKLPD